MSREKLISHYTDSMVNLVCSDIRYRHAYVLSTRDASETTLSFGHYTNPKHTELPQLYVPIGHKPNSNTDPITDRNTEALHSVMNMGINYIYSSTSAYMRIGDMRYIFTASNPTETIESLLGSLCDVELSFGYIVTINHKFQMLPLELDHPVHDVSLTTRRILDMMSKGSILLLWNYVVMTHQAPTEWDITPYRIRELQNYFRKPSFKS